jgi:hypothetical protein
MNCIEERGKANLSCQPTAEKFLTMLMAKILSFDLDKMFCRAQ